MAAKLHVLLAEESQREGQATKIRTDLAATLEKKKHLFGEKRITTTPLVEGGKEETDVQSTIQTTVKSELDWVKGLLSKAFDISHQIDIGNTFAKADIVLDDAEGTILLKDVPATSLLRLERRVKEVQQLITVIPTLDPARGFELDPQRPAGTYKAREVRKAKTAKVQEPIVLYPATKEHAAQTQLISKDVPVATTLEQEWSSLITPAAKADMLERCETLVRAVKRARAKANDLEVDTTTHRVGKTLLDYIF